MAAKIEKIVCKFIGDFKVGGNLVRNADALCRLSAANENAVFNKLMAIQAGSIVEASLHQIIYRGQNFTREASPTFRKQTGMSSRPRPSSCSTLSPNDAEQVK